MNPSTREYTTSLILNPPEELEGQRTYAIFGTRRGGTSMVAGVARALGLDLGEVGQRKNNEDPRFQNRPMPQMREAIEKRNAEHDVWGWKFPAAGNYIPELSNSLRNPYLIVVYRDPVAAALSQAKRDRAFNRRSTRLALHESSANNAVNTGLALATDRPCLLVSNERAVADPEGLIDDIAAFLGQEPPAGALREKILAYIKPGQYKSFDEFFGEGGDAPADSPSPDKERPGLLRRLRGDNSRVPDTSGPADHRPVPQEATPVKLEGLFNRRREDGPSGHEPRYVFVVTYGRSGSTLTQGLLNALPGTLVRGENNMFMLPFFRSWAGVREFQEKNNDNAINNGSRSAFYGLDEINPEDFIQTSRALTLQALYGSADRSKVKVLGYKEVLWHRIKRDEVEEFFGWFEQIFPGASYVLNQRDHESVRKSGFWQNQEEQRVMRTLRRVEDMQQFLRETRPDRTHDVRYERITSEDQSVKDKELRGLAEFVVGSCDDKVLKNMHDTLGQGHGPRPFGRSRGQAEESEDSSVSDSSE